MTTKEINKGNKLIAEFITLEIKDGWYYFDHPIICECELSYFKNFEFHSSWDWLMPVVEKICSLNLGKKRGVIFDLYPSSKSAFLQVREQKDNMGYPIVRYYPEEHENRSFIEHTYYACVEFIKWYNKQK